MRINSLTPQMNTKNNAKPSFGIVSFHKGRSSWHVSINRHEPEVVAIEGFDDFASEHARYLSDKFYELHNYLFSPNNYDGVKAHLNSIIDEAGKQFPKLTNDVLVAMRKPFDVPKPDISMAMRHAFIGEISLK